MPTVRQMYGGLYSLYKTTYSSGQLFRQTSNSKTNAASKNVNSLWSNYASTSSNSLAGLSSFSSNAKSLVKTYNQTKNAFDAEFSDTMTALKNSTNKIKNYDFNVGENAVEKIESVGENGEKIISTKYNDKLTDALKNVENFLSDYNDAINFFADNSSISKRVANLAKSFGDTTYFAKNYSEIGIVTGSSGEMKIDEEKLVDAITKNPSKVSRLLGSDGLAGKSVSHMNFANAQKNNLFPDTRQMLGQNLSAASFYGSKGFLSSNSYLGIGNLISAMF